MATAILNTIRNQCPRDFEMLKMRIIETAFEDIYENEVPYSYYAIPICNCVLPRSNDIIVGFFADTPMTFTFYSSGSCGDDFNLTKSLDAGEFQFAFYDDVFSYVSTQFKSVHISNLIGSGYIICAIIIPDFRRLLANRFKLGDYRFENGTIKGLIA